MFKKHPKRDMHPKLCLPGKIMSLNHQAPPQNVPVVVVASDDEHVP